MSLGILLGHLSFCCASSCCTQLQTPINAHSYFLPVSFLYSRWTGINWTATGQGNHEVIPLARVSCTCFSQCSYYDNKANFIIVFRDRRVSGAKASSQWLRCALAGRRIIASLRGRSFSCCVRGDRAVRRAAGGDDS